MKKRFNIALLTAACCLSANSFAAGIPTIDAAAISNSVSNQVETIAQWAQQLEQMKAQVEQAKSQLSAMTGSRGMGEIFKNANLDKALPMDINELLGSANSSPLFNQLRKEYPQSETLKKQNAYFDEVVKQDVLRQEFYKKSKQRFDLINQLAKQIDSAADPAAKADLANRFAAESAALEADKNLGLVIANHQQIEIEKAAKKASEEFICKEFGNRNC